jgi:hypothetical protein
LRLRRLPPLRAEGATKPLARSFPSFFSFKPDIYI